MKVKCDYCGNYIDQNSEKCECCGAPNAQYKRMANAQPETIEQLRDWYVAHNLPDENVTRFFIGKDYKGARAFGIYQDINGDFVVYKNKSDGTRVERYRGDDEAFAVNELYQKLRSEITNQKARNGKSGSSSKMEDTMKKLNIIIGITFCIGFVAALISVFAVNMNASHKEGYYRYQNQYYYHYDNYFYYYNDVHAEWKRYTDDFADDIDDYYLDEDVPEIIDDFKDSEAYERAYQNYIERQSYDDDDWDSGSSWDSSDSWDSSSTDWDSDW